jgi:rSAM/selenodomain-associated transferase 2
VNPTPDVAIIIPALNESGCIAATLNALGSEIAQSALLSEVIVVDGGSVDGTPAIVKSFPNIRLLAASRGRASQMNAGAAVSSAPLLVFLHADSQLPDGGLAEVAALMRDPTVVAGSFCLGFDAPHPILRLYGWLSRINLPISTFGDQALFLRRESFLRVGGFPPIPIMEDLEIQRALRRLGRFVKIRRPVRTSARRFLRRGAVRQQLLNIALVLLFLAGAAPGRLKRLYDDARNHH